MNARYKIGERVHLRYRHEILCLDIVNTLSNGVLGEPGYIVRRTDGKKLPFFRAVPESELSPCDCKPAKSFPAALPASPTLRLPNRSTDENPTIPKSNLNNNHRIWLKLQALLKEAEEVLGESEVSALKTRYGYKGNVRYWESNASLAITLEERLAEIKSIIDSAPLKVGDWVREKGHPVNVGQITDIITHETGLISHPVTVRFKTTFYRFNLWNARDLEPVDPPVSFVLIGRGELSTARRPVKIAGLLPAPKRDAPCVERVSLTSIRPTPVEYRRRAVHQEIQCATHWGEAITLSGDVAYWKQQTAWYAHVVQYLSTQPPASPAPVSPSTPPDEPPDIHIGDEVFIKGESGSYFIASAGVYEQGHYWYRAARKKGRAIRVPQSRISVFVPNPERMVGFRALIKTGITETAGKFNGTDTVVILRMEGPFAVIRRFCANDHVFHERMHYRNLTVLTERATPEEMADPQPHFGPPSLRRHEDEFYAWQLRSLNL